MPRSAARYLMLLLTIAVSFTVSTNSVATNTYNACFCWLLDYPEYPSNAHFSWTNASPGHCWRLTLVRLAVNRPLVDGRSACNFDMQGSGSSITSCWLPISAQHLVGLPSGRILESEAWTRWWNYCFVSRPWLMIWVLRVGTSTKYDMRGGVDDQSAHCLMEWMDAIHAWFRFRLEVFCFVCSTSKY